MKVGILGSRGIPNNYGGFEQFAARLSQGLLQKGAEVWVYNSHNHPWQEPVWKGINLVHCYDPEYLLGQAGQYIYDYNCISDSRKRGFDILMQLGYTSNSIWHKRLPRKPVIVTNMDGLEWKRSKYSRPVQRFLRYAERLAVESSHCLVADSEPIGQYLLQEYKVPSVFIPYGADIFSQPQPGRLKPLGLEPGNYFLLIARLQPDNHIEEIIQGVIAANTGIPLLLIGKCNDSYSRGLKSRYSSPLIRFHGPEFDMELLDNLRYYARLYFHGHSAGGTNPSLLEAMSASARICAHDNDFNRSVTNANALYFEDSGSVSCILKDSPTEEQWQPAIQNNLEKIKNVYNWDLVISAYYRLFSNMPGK